MNNRLIFLTGINKKFSETVVPRVAKAVCDAYEVDQKTIMEVFGVTFVNFVGQYPRNVVKLIKYTIFDVH